MAGWPGTDDVVLITKAITGDNYQLHSLGEVCDDDGNLASFKLSTALASTVPKDLLDRHMMTNVPSYLLSTQENQLHVVVSTGSGTGLAPSFFAQVLQPLLAAVGLEAGQVSVGATVAGYDVIETKSRESVRDFARTLYPADGRPAPSHTVILLSGDGGIVDILNAGPVLPAGAQPPPVMALLPLGTGNALFHSLHKPQYSKAPRPASPLVLGLRTLFTGRPSQLPTFQADFSPGARLVSGSETAEGDDGGAEAQGPPVSRLLGAIVASYGFHASLVWESDTPAYRVLGSQRFRMAAQELLKLGHAYACDVEVRRAGYGDGEPEWELLRQGERDGCRFNYLLTTLVSDLERTFTISPASAPLDGQLRLVSFGEADGQRTMDIMTAAYQEGKHVGMTWTSEDGREERVGYDAIEEMKVTIHEDKARWRKVCIDGTIVGLQRGGVMRVKRVEKPRHKVLAPIETGDNQD